MQHRRVHTNTLPSGTQASRQIVDGEGLDVVASACEPKTLSKVELRVECVFNVLRLAEAVLRPRRS